MNRKAGFDATEFLYDKGLEKHFVCLHGSWWKRAKWDRFWGIGMPSKKHGGQLLSLSLGSEGEQERTKAFERLFQSLSGDWGNYWYATIFWRLKRSTRAKPWESTARSLHDDSTIPIWQDHAIWTLTSRRFSRVFGIEVAALAIDSNLKIESNCVDRPAQGHRARINENIAEKPLKSECFRRMVYKHSASEKFLKKVLANAKWLHI